MLASLRSARSARLVVRRLAAPGVLGSHGRRLCHVPDRPDLPSAANRYHREWVNLLSDSLRMHTGQGLVPADCGYDADGDAHFAALAQHRSLIVVSHGIESSPVRPSQKPSPTKTKPHRLKRSRHTTLSRLASSFLFPTRRLRCVSSSNLAANLAGYLSAEHIDSNCADCVSPHHKRTCHNLPLEIRC